MISVKRATDLVLGQKIALGEEKVSLEDAIGKVLCEGLIADRDFPPYDRVTMDGIAINFAAFEQGRRKFAVEAMGAAGAPQVTLRIPENCIEIMTGAIMPLKADTVIRYEDMDLKNGVATINTDDIRSGQNIHYRAEDHARGSTVVNKGKVISSAEIGIAATVGKAKLKVAGFPKTIIISTGDELVEVTENPLPYQIRKSNVHRIKATLKSWGMQADMAHLQDDEKEVKAAMVKILDRYPVIIMSGGVSKGKFDYIPQVLDELGVEKIFHKIKQRPGKPFWFGKTQNGTLIFAFPGNPVSSFMCLHRYFRPWMLASLGLPPLETAYAILEEDVLFKPDLTYLLVVKLRYTSHGQILAKPKKGHGSGDLAKLAEGDAFIELPQGKVLFKKGESYPVLLYR